MLLFAVIATVISVATLLAYVAARPDTFRVERTTVIDAAPGEIYPFLEDFRKFTKWSPYEQLDPKMSRTFSGPGKGKGAAYEWSSRGKAGKGRMEIAHVSPPDTVVIRLDFVKPFESQNIVEFTLTPEGASTRVSWAMRGANPYAAKLMQLFVKMDRLVGRDFERGLENLKAIVETAERVTSEAPPDLPRVAAHR